MDTARAPVLGVRAWAVLDRIAVLVCPPELAELGLAAALRRDLEAHLRCLPPVTRRAAGPALRLFDQGARLRPAARGRRFLRLDDGRADAHLRYVLYERGGPIAAVVQLLRGLVVLCYYELPQVKAALGYDPDPYVAEVAARRQARYGPAIRAAEETERAEWRAGG
jgi:hypothetical protein